MVKTIFDKAIDEEFFSMIYAKLCSSLATAKDHEGADLIPRFRKILLDCCQKEFEKATKEDAAAGVEKMKEDAEKLKAEQAEKEGKGVKLTKEEKFAAREAEREVGYARNRVKRHMIGNIRFIGELFKADMVGSNILRHCIEHLMPDGSAEETNMENLCKLFETAGKKWEEAMSKEKKTKKSTAENRKKLADTFEMMDKIAARKGISARIKFAILDVLELRSRRWKPRMEEQGPKLISDVHAQAELEAIKSQREAANV